MDAIERDLRLYRAANGRVPYLDWFATLTDDRTRQMIDARIARVRLGNLGMTRAVGEGVHELKIDHGPGYRVYFGQDGRTIVILLCGGTKRRQQSDIRDAIEYWRAYNQEKRRANR